MKKFMIHIPLGVFAASVIIGCGGGGSGDAGPTAKLTDVNINALGQSAAKAMPGCVYTESASVSFSDIDPDLLQVLASDIKAKRVFAKTVPSRQERTIDETSSGSCGGTLHIRGSHDNGDSDVIYQYTNYCTGDATNQTRLNGSARVVTDGTPSPSGPVTESISVSTQGNGIAVTSRNNGEEKSATLSVTNFKWTKDGTTTIGHLKYASSDENYEVSGVDATFDSDTNAIKVNSATYRDPEVGTVSISTNTMSETAGGTITVKGSEGEAKFVSSSTNPKKFDAKNERGDLLGALDCSDVSGIE